MPPDPAASARPDFGRTDFKVPDFVLPGFVLEVERLYASLMQADPDINSDQRQAPAQAPQLAQDSSMGGKLVYAGELSSQSRALLVASNIAGAASLAATANEVDQKQAVRDGVADFLVTSLDEALRILKNEIRKHEPVAVCIAREPEIVEREMVERGVVPDLLAPLESFNRNPFGPRSLRMALDAEGGETLMAWRVVAAGAQWLPKLDEILLAIIDADTSREASIARRWVRFAPRYLGRLAQGVRVLRCRAEIAKEFLSRAQKTVHSNEIAVDVWIKLRNRIAMDGEREFRLHSSVQARP